MHLLIFISIYTYTCYTCISFKYNWTHTHTHSLSTSFHHYAYLSHATPITCIMYSFPTYQSHNTHTFTPFLHLHTSSCMIIKEISVWTLTLTPLPIKHFIISTNSHRLYFLFFFPVALSFSLTLHFQVKSPQEIHKKRLISVSILISIHKITFDLTFLLLTAQGYEEQERVSLSLSLLFLSAETRKITQQCLSLSINPLIYKANGIGVKLPLAILHLPFISLGHLSIPCGLYQNIFCTVHVSRARIIWTEHMQRPWPIHHSPVACSPMLHILGQ